MTASTTRTAQQRPHAVEKRVVVLCALGVESGCVVAARLAAVRNVPSFVGVCPVPGGSSRARLLLFEAFDGSRAASARRWTRAYDGRR
ncbi:hypothetical protein [Halobacterium sp. KA-6]|uniref:hypothetical protein n=1 Tax=Halobacterium sp. KA-6 TaxID=2896368 RepID=UPI001E3DDABB|nr:hypothetical protein [Halobacterium sp. KA-6]MCD2201974.1 hypothetical protein [Halobacterium sp. KA-6]